MELCKLAYSVQHSSAFKHFVKVSLQRQPQPGISLPTISKIVDRLVQISKCYRAASNMTAFMTKVKEVGRRMNLEALPASRIQIPELTN